MEIDVRMDKDSLSIPIENPFHLDIGGIVRKIEAFVTSKGATLEGLNVHGLIPRMVKGIAGCEGGCPADAMGFVAEGFRNFHLTYIEGGILAAKAATVEGKELDIKMFPDF